MTLASSFACCRAYSPASTAEQASLARQPCQAGSTHLGMRVRAWHMGRGHAAALLRPADRLHGLGGAGCGCGVERCAGRSWHVHPNSGPTRLHASSLPAAMRTLRTHYMHAPPPSPVAAGPSQVQSVSVLQMQLPANEGRGTNGSASMVRSAARRVGRSPCGILSANEGCSASSSAAPHIPTRIPLSGRRIYSPPLGEGNAGRALTRQKSIILCIAQLTRPPTPGARSARAAA